MPTPRQKHDFHIQKISSFPPFHTHFRRNLLRNAKKTEDLFYFFIFQICRTNFAQKKDKPEIASLYPFFGVFKVEKLKVFCSRSASKWYRKNKYNVLFISFSLKTWSLCNIFVNSQSFFPKYLIPILGVIPTHGRTKRLIMVCFEFYEFE
jgi:hypothetical protein